MSNHEELVEQGRALLIRTGSHLYGTATEESDEDFAGVFLPDERHTFGLARIEQVDLSRTVKDANGRNTKEAVDVVYYELRKFLRLAMECNPNVLELLFAAGENVVFASPAGRRLLAAARLFPYRGLYKRFVGYAHLQQHKMQVRTENYAGLTVAAERLRDIDPLLSLSQLMHRGVRCGMTWKDSHATCGDLSFMYHLKTGEVLRKIEARLAKATARSGLIERYGYDLKFGAHLMRLMMEGRDLLRSGELTFPLPEADTLRDIRAGKWKMEEVIQQAEELEREIDALKDTSALPALPRYNEIERLSIELLRAHLAAPATTPA